jgi:hypothetical protein
MGNVWRGNGSLDLDRAVVDIKEGLQRSICHGIENLPDLNPDGTGGQTCFMDDRERDSHDQIGDTRSRFDRESW